MNNKDIIKKAIIDRNCSILIEAIKNSIKNDNKKKINLPIIKEILQFIGINLEGLCIEGYIGDFPTFIEPVFLNHGVKIGDTVLLGPNVLIDKECSLGDFCELSNTILFEGVSLEKYCKLNWCIVDQGLTLPQKFIAKKAFITKNVKGEIQLF